MEGKKRRRIGEELGGNRDMCVLGHLGTREGHVGTREGRMLCHWGGKDAVPRGRGLDIDFIVFLYRFLSVTSLTQ